MQLKSAPGQIHNILRQNWFQLVNASLTHRLPSNAVICKSFATNPQMWLDWAS
jgi:hypothetical protein